MDWIEVSKIAGPILVGIFGLLKWFIFRLDKKFEEINKKFEIIDAKFDRIISILNQQAQRLSVIETRLEERGHYDFRKTGTEEKKS